LAFLAASSALARNCLYAAMLVICGPPVPDPSASASVPKTSGLGREGVSKFLA
jgi:hypothetical protein